MALQLQWWWFLCCSSTCLCKALFNFKLTGITCCEVTSISKARKLLDNDLDMTPSFNIMFFYSGMTGIDWEALNVLANLCQNGKVTDKARLHTVNSSHCGHKWQLQAYSYISQYLVALMISFLLKLCDMLKCSCHVTFAEQQPPWL